MLPIFWAGGNKRGKLHKFNEMMRLIGIGLYVMLLWCTGGCQPGPKPIDYGAESCSFCRMTIVDRQHAAEIVTNKGKVYKFDSAECMVNSIGEIGKESIAIYLCNTFNEPGILTDATAAAYLISEALPSPMGANLTAFTSAEEANKALEMHGGKVYLWESLVNYFERQNAVFQQ